MVATLKSYLNQIYVSLPNRLYLPIFYYQHTGRRLRLKNPVRFTHKIQWLKLHGRMERLAPFADKYMVRQYVERTIGGEHLVPLLGVWERAEDIDFESLPERFVLKVTTGCGFNYICKNKADADLGAIKKQLDAWTAEDFYRYEREPQYKSHVPRIIAEAYLQDETGSLRDFKVHCSGGEPKIIQVDTDRFTDHKTDCFDTEWRKIDSLTPHTFGDSAAAIMPPATFPQMLDLARQLAADFPYVRVDFYSVGNTIYFGELTFTPGSGIVKLPEDGDLMMGGLISLEAYRRPLPFEAARDRAQLDLVA